MIDITDSKFGGLIKDPGYITVPQSEEEAGKANRIRERMTKKCDEWTQLLSKNGFSASEIQEAINCLLPTESQPVNFGATALAELNLDKLDEFFKESAGNRSFIGRDGSYTKSFKKTKFARQLGYALNHINVMGATTLIIRRVKKALYNDPQAKEALIEKLKHIMPIFQERLLNLEKPEDILFGNYQSILSTPALAASYFAGHKMNKNLWADMVDRKIAYEDNNQIVSPEDLKGIVCTDLTSTLGDALEHEWNLCIYRMKKAYFGDTTPLFNSSDGKWNANNIGPRLNDPEHRRKQLEIIEEQYITEFARFSQCPYAEAEKIFNSIIRRK